MIKDKLKAVVDFEDPGYIVVDFEQEESTIKYFGISKAAAAFVIPLNEESRAQLFATIIDLSNANIRGILENLPNEPSSGDIASASNSVQIVTSQGEWRCIIVSFIEFGTNAFAIHSYTLVPDEVDAALRSVLGNDYEDLPGVQVPLPPKPEDPNVL